MDASMAVSPSAAHSPHRHEGKEMEMAPMPSDPDTRKTPTQPPRGIMHVSQSKQRRQRVRISFADEHGQQLEEVRWRRTLCPACPSPPHAPLRQVYYSDKLHYSAPDFSGDSVAPCCTVL